MNHELIVDLHTHSRFSRATSPQCTLEGLYYWGKLKGVAIIGTGDFTHPLWLAQLQTKLEPAEPGLYKLKELFAHSLDQQLPASVRPHILRFVLTTEISTVYRKGGKTRKIHQLIVLPSLQTVIQLNQQLGRIGNLAADGRPILGLDAKELLRLTLTIDPNTCYIPAHVWTPWFGLLGSKSGFDSLTEAYDELAPYVRAIESGMSSDPAMNWRIAELADRTIVSHSDGHSPQNIGREATIVNCSLNYNDIIGAYRTNDQRLVGTVEFFPQEGKYYLDGHRKCGICFTPQQTKSHAGICPICQKSLVVGVSYRVEELATYPSQFLPPNRKQVEYIVPLPELVAHLIGIKNVKAKAVSGQCKQLYELFGDEFSILRTLPTALLHKAGFERLALAIEAMRCGNIHIRPGYDGVYGIISL